MSSYNAQELPSCKDRQICTNGGNQDDCDIFTRININNVRMTKIKIIIRCTYCKNQNHDIINI